MRVLQGSFYSTAFRVRDEAAFGADPAILEMQQHLDMFVGEMDGATVHCLCSKGTQPKTMLQVFAPAIAGLLADTRSSVAMEDPQGWIETLQRHLDPDYGIVLDETLGDERFMTYVAADRVGWTR
jgi:hypothetical protein